MRHGSTAIAVSVAIAGVLLGLVVLTPALLWLARLLHDRGWSPRDVLELAAVVAVSGVLVLSVVVVARRRAQARARRRARRRRGFVNFP